MKVLSEAHHVARSRLASAQSRQKKFYNIHLHEQQYEEGDVVYRLDESTKIGVSKNLLSPWRGPCVVTNSSPPLYTICDKRNKELTVHHDKLKSCNDRDLPLWVRRLRNNLFHRKLKPFHESIKEEGDMD